MAEAIRLSDKDWEVLLPGEKFKLGETELSIVPLGLEKFKEAMVVIEEAQAEFAEDVITEENWQDPKNLIKITRVVLEKAPQLLADSSGLALEDILRLPPAPAVALTSKVIEVNIDSQEDLSKNLEALAVMISSLGSGALAISSTSSSDKATE